MERTVSYRLTPVNSPKRTNFRGQFIPMRNDLLPDITGPHFDFAERFRQAVAFAELLVYDQKTKKKKSGSYDTIAQQLDCSRVYVGEMFRGEKFPSGLKGVKYAAALGVSPVWLMSGEGPMVVESLISIEHLHPEDRDVVKAMIKSMERRL